MAPEGPVCQTVAWPLTLASGPAPCPGLSSVILQDREEPAGQTSIRLPLDTTETPAFILSYPAL